MTFEVRRAADKLPTVQGERRVNGVYRRWTVSKPDSDAERLLCEEFGIEPAAARVAVSRGLTDPESLTSFFSEDSLDFDPLSLDGVKEAADVLLHAVKDGKRIMVFGDYDCDGVTSTALMYLCLKDHGADVIYKIPDRLNDGYGLSTKYVEYAKQEGIDVIVTVDNGVNCVEEALLAAKYGITLVITDHHMPQEKIPEAAAVVDPHIGGDNEFTCLAGVGVAFLIACAMSGAAPSELMWQYGDLVAIGTVSDVMPLSGINRAIVKLGLDVINSRTRVGTTAIFDNAGYGDKEVTSSAVSFTLAPRINAAGRMGSATTALELLLTDDPEIAAETAARIGEMNTRRQRTEQEIVAEAVKKIEMNGYKYDRMIVVSGENWHRGVVGISASKLVERYGRPVIVLCEEGDAAVGSGRGVAGFSLFEALLGVGDILTRFGGHELAAGLTVERSRIDELRTRLNELDSVRNMPFLTVRSDCVLNPNEVSLDTAYALAEFEPCGAGNPVPVFLLKEWNLDRVTPLSGGNHQRLTLSKYGVRISALLFGVRPDEMTVFAGDLIDASVTLGINEYRDEESLSVYVKAVRTAGSGGRECEAAERRYEDYRAGKADGESAKEMIPDRNDFAAVYRFVSGVAVCNRDAILSKLGKKIGYDKCEICIDSLCEAELLSSEHRGSTVLVSCSGRTEKANLQLTETLRKLKEISEGGVTV